MYQMRRPAIHNVQVGNQRISYQTLGDGDPVILVHGLSGSLLWWSRNIQDLAQDHRVYLVDLPGFGSMRRVSTRFTIMKAAQWLLAWMETVNIQKADFIGHSMGGYICIWIAAHHPALVSRLVLVSPAVLSEIRKIWGYAIPLLSTIAYLQRDFFFILIYDALRAGPLTLLQATYDLLSVDAQEEIARISVPTLLIWGENDTLVPPSIGHTLHTKLASSRLVILHNASHISMYDQPAQFNALVKAFFNGEGAG
ncbi:alpha/beta fold hydrolase [Tengunoibacter tsumagoiensis]|uniref:Dihydrolipoamide acetyltransferase n=1 Tax=Tengunoibacter tsumagoiensis TaxID=2014871 RepID=A0A402AA20_9CHLR|nr:alpha/beta hydrolase [Tengunoibacter tsumagoiensis]GCE16024.1 dihydrolipoamide acetyltransferase [Tengunoibacter tsumagoiensis]